MHFTQIYQSRTWIFAGAQANVHAKRIAGWGLCATGYGIWVNGCAQIRRRIITIDQDS
jgi:hypothetical protein